MTFSISTRSLFSASGCNATKPPSAKAEGFANDH
jgi:hypothetical protein